MTPEPPRSLAADADRERILSLLREHYARGRYDLDEFSRRAGLVLAAEYADEAASAVADLPPLDLAQPGSSTGRRAGGRRRHAQAVEPGPGWVPTQERFRDPSSGKITRVWIDPADQSRHYVPEPGT
jgi:Domain of unknown function (DUF1707)